MKYFEVTAKCGHVGRGRYYAGNFYVQAQNKIEAEIAVRMKPRVKHGQKDAILSIEEIGYDDFKKGQAAHRTNPYFRCRSEREQNAIINNIVGNIRLEDWRAKRMWIKQVLSKSLKKSARRRSEQRQKRDFLLRMWRKVEKYGHDYIIELEAAA